MKLKEQIPDAELKLMLISNSALKQDSTLSDDMKTLFGFDDEPENVSIWYLDTPAQDIRKAGWSVRFRQFSDDGGLELTFKKRYSEKDYKAMLTTDEAKKFAAEFKPELDIEYSSKTCSLSFERIFTDMEEALNEGEAKRLAILNSPPVFIDWNEKNAGFVHLCASTLMGPVIAASYKGDYEGLEAKLEIWKLNTVLTELSFDISTKKSTQLKRDLLKSLTEYNLLTKQNLLKTDAFLDYYGNKKKNAKSAQTQAPANLNSSQP